MNFVKYNNRDRVEVNSAALALSGLDKCKQLEMHTLDHALVMLKDDMTNLERVEAMTSLLNLVNSIMDELVFFYEEEDRNEPMFKIDDTENGGVMISERGEALMELSPHMVEKLKQNGVTEDELVEILTEIIPEILEDGNGT